MRTIRRWTLSSILAVVAASALSFGAATQSRQFSFAYDQPKGSGYDAGADIFDKKLKELSNGAFSINKYPGAQLGTEAQTMQKVQTGDIDFVFLSTANASTAQPESLSAQLRLAGADRPWSKPRANRARFLGAC